MHAFNPTGKTMLSVPYSGPETEEGLSETTDTHRSSANCLLWPKRVQRVSFHSRLLEFNVYFFQSIKSIIITNTVTQEITVP